MNKRIIILFAVMAAAVSAAAHDYAVPNNEGVMIYYNDVSSNTKPAVEVTYQGTWFGAYENEYQDTVIIPNTVVISSKTYAVIGIGEQAFAESFKLTSVTIPESIEYIGDKAFQSCCRVKEVNYNAIRCADFSLPDFAPFSYSNMSYGTYVYPADDPDFPDLYWSAYDLRTINIGASVVRVPDYMFYGMGGELAQADYTSRPYKFTYSKEGVINVNFLGVPAEIGNQAFRRCRVMRNITIPDGVKSFGQALFADCDTLASVVLPDDMTEIPAYFFMNCKELASFTFPSQVKSINYEAFKNCAKLTNLNNLPAGLTVIGPSAFRACQNVSAVTLPGSLTTIDGYAFSDCTSLGSIDIPASVAKIGNYAFEDCTQLTTVTIHAGTEEIGNFVFAGCRKLSKGTVNAPARMPRIYAQTFQDVENSMTVNVEGGDESEYAADAYWGRFFAPRAIEQANESAPKAQKVIRNGQLIILHTDKQYNVLGNQL